MSIKLFALRLVAVLGAGVSMAGLVDHFRVDPVFCGFESGCEEVTASGFGQVAGVPLAALGVAAFVLFLAVSLFPTSAAGRLLGPMALLAGTVGLALVLVQALVLKRFCPLCLVADACGMLLATIQLGGPQGDVARAGRPWRWAWAGLAVAALAAPPLASWLRPSPPVPEAVKASWVAGKVTVFAVTDFDCRSCRETHPALAEFLEEEAGRVHFVQLVLPLARNANARPAARAYWCARKQSKGSAMAGALFEADDLSPAGCARIAARLGLDQKMYEACIADPATDPEIDAASAWVRGTGARGLPVIWVQDQMLVGVQTQTSLRAAFQRALRRQAAAMAK
jgi:uncharacterized membrane protein